QRCNLLLRQRAVTVAISADKISRERSLGHKIAFTAQFEDRPSKLQGQSCGFGVVPVDDAHNRTAGTQNITPVIIAMDHRSYDALRLRRIPPSVEIVVAQRHWKLR